MNLKKILSAVVSVAMLIGAMGTVAMANEGPDATVTVLPATTLAAGDYTEYDLFDSEGKGQTLKTGEVDRPLNVVMNFKANETPEQAQAGKYGEWITDFYVTLDNVNGDTIELKDCYLAGNYGTFGWIVIPLDGLEIEDGFANPIVTNTVDQNLTYNDICGSVKDFTAAIYVTPEILTANPDMELTLELKVTSPDKSQEIVVGSYTYASAAKVGDKLYMSIEEAVAAANANDTIVIQNDVAVTNPIVIDKDITLDLGGNKISNLGSVYPIIRVQNGATLTVSNGTVENTDDYAFVLGSSDSATSGNLVINGGTYKGMTTIASVTKGTLTINDGYFETFAGEYGSTYLLNCIDANYKAGANIVVNGGKFVGFNPKNNAAEGKGTCFIADGYTTKLVNGAYTVVEDEAEEVEVIPAETNEGTTVSRVLFEQVGEIKETVDEKEVSVPWCSYSFEVTGAYSTISVSVKKGDKVLPAIEKSVANIDGQAMYGVVVTGLDSLSEIIVTTN